MAEPKRSPRADSRRNRTKILDAARRRIGESGSETAMSDIAAEAGVAVGTLYNHFPTKLDLVSAVLAEYVSNVADRASGLRDAVETGEQSAGGAVTEFLQYVLDVSANNYAVKTMAQALGSSPEASSPEETRAAVALDHLLARAQQEGAVRAGINAQDIYLLISSAPLGAAQPARDRWLTLVMHGIRVP